MVFICLTGVLVLCQNAQAQSDDIFAETSCANPDAPQLGIALPEIIETGNGAEPTSIFRHQQAKLGLTLSNAGYCVNFHLLPWLRTDALIKSGKLDGFVATQNIGWYKRDFIISAPFARIDVYVLTKPDKFLPEGYNYEDLAGLNVAILLGDSLGFELSGRGIPYVTLPTTASLTRFIEAGRVDAVLGYQALFEKSAADALAQGLLKMSYIDTRELYLMIYREVDDAQAIIDRLNQSLVLGAGDQ